jgi:hypothetical protein
VPVRSHPLAAKNSRKRIEVPARLALPKSVRLVARGGYIRRPVRGFMRVSAMAIIEEYNAIAKRLRELRAVSPKGVDEITNLERWRDLARQTAQEYVENRRRA